MKRKNRKIKVYIIQRLLLLQLSSVCLFLMGLLQLGTGCLFVVGLLQLSALHCFDDIITEFLHPLGVFVCSSCLLSSSCFFFLPSSFISFMRTSRIALLLLAEWSSSSFSPSSWDMADGGSLRSGTMAGHLVVLCPSPTIVINTLEWSRAPCRQR